MIIEGVITGAEKFGRDNVVPESESHGWKRCPEKQADRKRKNKFGKDK